MTILLTAHEKKVYKTGIDFLRKFWYAVLKQSPRLTHCSESGILLAVLASAKSGNGTTLGHWLLPVSDKDGHFPTRHILRPTYYCEWGMGKIFSVFIWELLPKIGEPFLVGHTKQNKSGKKTHKKQPLQLKEKLTNLWKMVLKCQSTLWFKYVLQ